MQLEDVYPLSPLQQGMLFHALYAPHAGVDLMQIVIDLPEEVDADALRGAWAAVAARHPVLRTRFRWEGVESPVQEVCSDAPIPWTRRDLAELPPGAREEAVRAFLREDRRTGFDLAQAPLMRLALLRLAPADHRMVWTIHHSIMDGRSSPVVLFEVFGLYDARGSLDPASLPPARPYREFIEWLQERDGAAAERFWSGTLRGFTPPEPLVLGEPVRDADEAPGATEIEVRLPEAATQALREAARRHGASLNTLVQGAWAVLLSRYTGAADLVFGTTRTWRRSLEADAGPTVGMFFNTVPVRAGVDEAAPISALLRELRERAVAMREHEHTPLRRIQEWAGVPADVPLFDTVVNYDVTSVDAVLLAAGGAWARRRHRQIGDANLALGLTAYGEPGLLLDLTCDPRRVGPAAAERALGHVRSLLEAIAADPDRPVGELPLLAAAEREQLLAGSPPGRGAALHGDACVHRLVEERAALAPGAPAVSGPGGSLTYGELDRLANRLANHLVALGVRRESRVAVCLGRSHQEAVALLAVLKAGAAFVPVDPAYPAERIAHVLEDSRARVLLTRAELLAGLPAVAAETVCLDRDREAIARRGDAPPAVPVDPRGLAYVVYTSGSTGRPKGVMVEHRSLLNLVLWHTAAFGVTAADRAARVAGPAFDASVWELWPPLAAGASVHAADDEVRASPAALRDWIAERGITVAFLPTPLAEEALRLDWPADTPLRLLLTGGDRLRSRPGPALPFELVNNYGPTEGTVVATSGRVDPAGEEDGPLPHVGRAIDGARLRVLDARMRLVPRGVPGELHLGGEGVARGYLGQPALTAGAFVPDPFAAEPGARLYRTGDRVRLREDGALEFLGRTDHQVKVRGFRIEPAEVETALRRHPAVRDAVVVAREERSAARRLVAYLTPAGDSLPPASELRALAGSVLPDYMVPGAFVFLEQFPTTPNGKLDRDALPPPGADAADREAPGAAASPTEELLARTWAEVLGVEEPGVHDNFFELGGDSILAIQVVVRASQAGLQLTPKLLYQYPTVASLARAVGSGGAAPSEQGPVVGPAPLTPVQRWFLERDHPDPHYYDQSMLLLVWEGADTAALETAVRHLAVHHDALRMRFARGPGGWEQANAAPGAEAPVARVDLAALREQDRAAAVTAAAGAAQASLRLAEGPLFRGVLFGMGAGRPGRLLLAAHHLVVDGVSWRILLEDLVGAHRQAEHGEPVRLPPKTTSFREWAMRLAEHAGSAAAEAELAFWQAERSAPAPLPVDGARGPNPVGAARTVVATLEAAETAALLREANRAYNTRVDDLLAAALARTFCAWTGARTFLFDMEGHGREALLDGVDVSRTVGWFTSIYPVRVSLEGAGGPGEAIRSVKEQLRAIPGRGAGYGVLRHLHPDPAVRRRLAALPQAEVSFNYLGQFDQAFAASGLFERAPEPAGWSRSPRQWREYLLEVTGRVTGGELRLTWTYGEGIHARATVEGLAERFLAELRALVAHCRAPEAAGFTPSDFPEAEIGSQEELDELLAVLALDEDPDQG